ncbi:MAG: MerR family transcriptional regulator [Myxococcota bacterium]
MDQDLKIGAVARRAEVSVDTVRYYERRGLLPQPRRLESGYRIYDAAIVDRIRFIQQMQPLGFRLDEVRDVLAMVDDGSATCKNQQGRFQAVLSRIDHEIAALRATRRKIVSVLNECQRGKCRWSGSTKGENAALSLGPGG